MKKVRVIKEMPFAKVGDVFEIYDTAYVSNAIKPGKVAGMYEDLCVDSFIREGWLEYVEEEKSLEEKLNVWFKNKVRQYQSSKSLDGGQVAQIAKEHYLEVFNKATIRCVSNEIEIARKALEKA